MPSLWEAVLSENHERLQLVAGNGNPALAERIAQRLNLSLSACQVKRFSDGESQVLISNSMRGHDVWIIQSTGPPVNDHQMEILIIIDAQRRASANSINCVIPYMCYARQDKKVGPREPITAKLVANLMEKAGASRVLTMDVHAPSIQGFFDIPVDHLTAIPLLARDFRDRGLSGEDVVVVSPDVGGVVRARQLSNRLDSSLAIIAKRRPRPNVVEMVELVGNVQGKTCIMIDDMIDTAGTIVMAAEELINHGAKEVYACCTHPLLSGPAVERLKNPAIKELVVTDTLPLPPEKSLDKIRVLTVSDLFAEAIVRGFEQRSISELFD